MRTIRPEFDASGSFPGTAPDAIFGGQSRVNKQILPRPKAAPFASKCDARCRRTARNIDFLPVLAEMLTFNQSND